MKSDLPIKRAIGWLRENHIMRFNRSDPKNGLDSETLRAMDMADFTENEIKTNAAISICAARFIQRAADYCIKCRQKQRGIDYGIAYLDAALTLENLVKRLDSSMQ